MIDNITLYSLMIFTFICGIVVACVISRYFRGRRK